MKDGMSGSLKFEAEFFRKSNNLTVAREKKIRSIQVRTIHMLLLLILALLIAMAVSRAANLFFTCEALQVRSFRLRHQPVYERERLAAILRRFNDNILAVNLKELRLQLLQIPEVADASIRRVLPDAVAIDFTLRRPFYRYGTAGAFRLLDETGLELGRSKQAPPGLIPLRGGLASLAAIVPFSRSLRALHREIEYVAWDEVRGIELKLLGAGEVFYPGDSDCAGRIRHYFRIKKRLTLPAAVKSVDLRIPGRIYLEFDEGQRGTT